MQEIWKFSPSSLEEVQFWQVWWSWAYCNCSIIWIACILWRTPEISASCPAQIVMPYLFVIKDDPMLTLVLAKCNTRRIWCKNRCGLYIVQQDRYLVFVHLFSVIWASGQQLNIVVPGREGCGCKGQDWLWEDLCLPSPTSARATEVVLRRAYPKTCTKCLHPGSYSRIMPAGSEP